MWHNEGKYIANRHKEQERRGVYAYFAAAMQHWALKHLFSINAFCANVTWDGRSSKDSDYFNLQVMYTNTWMRKRSRMSLMEWGSELSNAIHKECYFGLWDFMELSNKSDSQ